jgi:hypothetical protein
VAAGAQRRTQLVAAAERGRDREREEQRPDDPVREDLRRRDVRSAFQYAGSTPQSV